ncbi:MAG: hypothetical protein KME17_23800 [Cyanosarcina radialis HA8281-LM2]|jgi:hypothetical protein|nr:hypothetical protein [Cyanosarcina radialis HA8281-LM2]
MLYYTGVTQNDETQLYQLWYVFEPNFKQLHILSAHKNQIAALEAMQRLTLVHCNSKPLTCHEDVVKIAGSFPGDGEPQPFNAIQTELIRRQVENQ